MKYLISNIVATLILSSTQTWATSIMPGNEATAKTTWTPVVQQVLAILPTQGRYSGKNPDGTSCEVAIYSLQDIFQINLIQPSAGNDWLLDSSIQFSGGVTSSIQIHLHYASPSESGDRVYSADFLSQNGVLSVRYVIQNVRGLSPGTLIPDPPADTYNLNCSNLVLKNSL